MAARGSHSPVHESPYSKQLERGFNALRFAPGLEVEFRQQYLRSIRRRVVTCIVILISFSVLAAIENRGGSAAPPDSLLQDLRVFVVRPLSVFLLLSAFIGALYERVWLNSTPVILCIIGLIGGYSTAEYVAGGNLHAFIAMVSGLLGTFLLLGLLFWQTLVVATLIGVGYFVSLSLAAAPPDVIRFEAAVLVAMTGLALVFVYHLEHSLRESFLQRRVLQDLGEYDAMTGLKNRRAFDVALEALWRQALRDKANLGLLMVDIDYFKAYNDYYGHQAGDRCLGAIGAIIARTSRRPLDVAARIGGEEFAVLLYGAGPEHLAAIADQILCDVQLAKIPHQRSTISDRISVSIGVGQVTPKMGRSPASLLQYVDEALYEAKDAGRNRVVFRDRGYDKLVTGVFQADVKKTAPGTPRASR
ncbi:MAG: diguanylate cyclase [Pseudomonadota bacterium]